MALMYAVVPPLLWTYFPSHTMLFAIVYIVMGVVAALGGLYTLLSGRALGFKEALLFVFELAFLATPFMQ